MASPADPPRLIALDVLRGLAILLMIFSGMLPKTLPNWLDHGYQPHYRPDASGAWVSTLMNGSPPFDARWKAFTWVDLVFPMFLFAMGAAIPLAMSRRLERDRSIGRALGSIAARAGMLVLFAVIVTQMTVSQLSWPQQDVKRVLVLIGFAAAFAFFVRTRRGARPRTTLAIRMGALLVILGLIVACLIKGGGTFSWGESDVIILVLAHMYLIGAALWLFTRRWGWLRLVVIAPLLLLAHYLQFNPRQFGDWMWLGEWPTALRPIASFPSTLLNLPAWLPLGDGSAARLLNFAPLWNVTWLKFLWIVVPGTIVGDRVLAWSRGGKASVPPRAQRGRLVFALSLAITASVCVGLRNYGFTTLALGGPFRTPWPSLLLSLPLVAWLGAIILRAEPNVNAAFHRWLFTVGTAFLVIGLALACAPSGAAREGFFEGGISKGSPATLSYYATSVGLCVLLLLGLTSVLDAPTTAPRRLRLIEANGQNPMIAYYLAHAVLGAVLTLGVFTWIGQPLGAQVRSVEDLFAVPLRGWPWLYAIWGAIKTLMIAAFAWWLTKRRIVWRA